MILNTEKYYLADVCKIIAGQSPDSQSYNTNGDGIPFFQGKADFGTLYPKITTYCSQPLRIAEKDDILLSIRAPVGPTNLAPCKVCIGRGLSAIRPCSKLNIKFVLYFFKYFESQLAQMGTGTTFKAITQDIIKKIQIPVPKLTEQERIIAKIEELFSELDSAVAELKTVKKKLQIYRQAVLSAAFSHVDDKNMVTLDSISEISSGITKGRDLSKEATENIIELPYLRVANVQNGYLDLSEIKTIQLKVSEKEKYLLQFEDVLYTEGGDRDKLGRGTLWRNEIKDCVHQNHIFKARINRQKALPLYVSLWSMSSFARNYFYNKGKQSVNLASINKTVLSNLPIYLPDINEQSRIVQDIDVKLSYCDNIEKTIDPILSKAAALRQSILKQAFDGKL
ncbi:MAG: restriction endonuclease subunit S [Lentisphaeria bacterium]|nr:restriction endonuclease subunit S [Lentisphaeria bacterium]